ncbi:MAG: oligosaccharide repeat unit polymerase [Bacteroidales bacterium]|nr:oligosaccharide repeat unit polymerase [Bacteroidales bacterium]
MLTLDYLFCSIIILFSYLILLLSRRKYKIVLPSTSFCLMWTVTVLLLIFQVKGFWVTYKLPESSVSLVAPFIFYLCIACTIGFIVAHILTTNANFKYNYGYVDVELLDYYLKRFKWIPYVCGAVGTVLFAFLVSTIGNVENFNEYRQMALVTKRVGYAEVAQRISGHINILGGFYLMLYGYVCGQKGIRIGNFLWVVFLCSMINISIGGRVWILTSLLPFFTTYILSIKYVNSDFDQRLNTKKLIYILLIFISLFALIGLVRGNGDGDKFIDKFLYLTDGSRMTNIMLNFFPPGTYQLENGKSTILGGILDSPMVNMFAGRISFDIGLSVTVKSIMPNLYYDFGLYGGPIFMGFICIILEIVCLYLRYSNSVLSLICYGTIAGFLVQSPVGNVFSLYTPTFEWLIIIILLKRWIFNKGLTNFDNNHNTPVTKDLC